jgi:Cu/Ag efflux pump CusA
LLVPLVILCALSLAVTGAFVALAETGHARDLSAIISLLMLSGMVVTNAIVLLDLVQHRIEAGDDVCTALIQAHSANQLQRATFRPHLHPHHRQERRHLDVVQVALAAASACALHS